MRHVLAARAIAARPCSVCEAPRTARLVATPGLAHRGASRDLRAGLAAVDVAAIAARAQHYLSAATRAHEQPPRLASHRATSANSRSAMDAAGARCNTCTRLRSRPTRAPGGGARRRPDCQEQASPRLLYFGCRSIAASIGPRDTARQHSTLLLVLPGGALRAPGRTSEIEAQSKNRHHRRLDLRGR